MFYFNQSFLNFSKHIAKLDFKVLYILELPILYYIYFMSSRWSLIDKSERKKLVKLSQLKSNEFSAWRTKWNNKSLWHKKNVWLKKFCTFGSQNLTVIKLYFVLASKTCLLCNKQKLWWLNEQLVNGKYPVADMLKLPCQPMSRFCIEVLHTVLLIYYSLIFFTANFDVFGFFLIQTEFEILQNRNCSLNIQFQKI